MAGPRSAPPATPSRPPEIAHRALAAAHDLKEPLRTLVHYSDLLRNRYSGKLDNDADEYLAFMHDAASRMRSEVQRLFSENDAPAPVSIPAPSATPPQAGAPADTGAAFERAVANLRASIVATNAVITHGPLPPISISEDELVQVLQNLIGNAIKFHGDEPPRVHVTVARTAAEWLVSVEDNGIGIPQEDMPRLFAMFERGSAPAHVNGSGIGLAVSRSIVERYGGRIWATRNGSRGSTFFFTVPVPEIGSGAPRSAPRMTSLRPVS
jgi:light-regulated signal transduction histidine kinase (bacteriophytochrome)